MPVSNKPSLNLDTFNFVFRLDNTFLTDGKRKTYLSSDVVAAGTTLPVQSIAGLSSTAQLLLVGEIGDGKSEFAYMSNGTVPNGTTIYLKTALTFDHPQDTKVYAVDYDQFAISRATGVSSEKGTLATEAIQIAQLESIYKDATNSTGYGFLEFKHSIDLVFSRASDPVPYVGFADNTVFMIKHRALNAIGEEINEIVTNEFLNAKLWEARREYHNSLGKRPFRKKYNTDIGNVSTGMYRILAPTDLQAPYTAENLYGVRIGTKENMSYIDKKSLDKEYEGSARTKLTTAYTVADQDLYCDDVRDLDDSGSVKVENDTIIYSAKGVTGGTLRISTDGEYNHDVDVNVWQGVSMGLPNRFTVFVDSGSAYIYFNKPIDTAYVNKNVWCDYYRNLVEFSSDADEIDEPDPVQDAYVHFLSYAIKKRKDKGVKSIDDDDFMLWVDLKKTSLSAEYDGENIRLSPAIDHLIIPY